MKQIEISPQSNTVNAIETTMAMADILHQEKLGKRKMAL